MTIAPYARRKGWPLEGVTVRLEHAKIHATDCAECETKEGLLDRIEREISLGGALTDLQPHTTSLLPVPQSTCLLNEASPAVTIAIPTNSATCGRASLLK